MGILYLVSTPIGNLQDITLRAIKTLFAVDVIACEDTRRTNTLLDNLLAPYQMLANHENAEHHRPHLLSYYEQNELRRIPEILSLLHQGQKIALVSDAGTPAVSDPGFKLIREAIAAGFKVEVIPGASSVLTALLASGLPTDKFTFVGYPPRKPGHRMKFYENIKSAQELLKTSIILFEAPHKVMKTLVELESVFGDIEVVFARELTKKFEEVKKKKISQALLYYKKKEPKGEFVLVFHL